ncbi:hypothetical protein NHX12_017927 [Muraenolepis orangiensis]|uniref:Uncharacterized protein n=1 Tax=Muraenolepis orangiensis TaxID=630683 RepID=A0A9Q0IY51_9TELE|nr:hypothetical protein NHX12_017927 [Muraenolepis orangiensis]
MSGPSARIKATKKAHEAAENPGALPGTPAGSNQLTLSAFNEGMAQMKTDICGKMDSVVDSLRAEIALVPTELLTKFDKLKCEVTDLQNKCDDLEGRQRRNNIRVLGVPEGVEGPHPTEYMADLLGDLLQLVDKPVLDRAHRSSRAKPRAGEPPRPFVIRIHHFQTKELILRMSRAAGDSSFQVGIGFPFFRIWPRLSRKNVEFWKAKQMGNGKERYFENPTEATVFAKRLAPGPGSV